VSSISQYYESIEDNKHNLSIWEIPVLSIIGDGNSILEIGAGSGVLTRILHKTNNVSCIDLSLSNVNKLIENGLNAYQINIESQPLPFPDNTFDKIIMIEVIEHLFEPYYPLSEIKRVLKDNGELIISTHNVMNWYMRLKYLLGEVNITCDISKGRGEHIRLYSHKILRKVLSTQGFMIKKTDSWFKVLGIYIKPFMMKSLLAQHILVRCIK